MFIAIQPLKPNRVINWSFSQLIRKLFVKILFLAIFLSVHKSIKASEEKNHEKKYTDLEKFGIQVTVAINQVSQPVAWVIGCVTLELLYFLYYMGVNKDNISEDKIKSILTGRMNGLRSFELTKMWWAVYDHFIIGIVAIPFSCILRFEEGRKFFYKVIFLIV